MNRRGVERIERVVLLGYMCSGKSTVGESVARRLSWNFVDFDVEIERREQRRVWEIIEGEGEEYFRRLESELTREASEERRLVMAPGGGWITNPELLEAIRPGTFSVWLRVSPEETVRRLLDDSIDRPLKEHPDPIRPVSEMLEEREPLYRRADLAIPGDSRHPEELAFEIESIVRLRNAPP
ncbi:MAG: shikimate kinase [Gemmatimonadota bacterium]